MEWSIQDVARLAGTTSRTLRHYDDVGVVKPSRVGANGYRYYDEQALVRVQRVLLLRELGLALPQIADVLAHRRDESSALTTHLALLRQEQDRLARQIAAVEHTIASLEGRADLMADHMFDGFDHTRHREEVEQRWGTDGWARADAWWRGKDADERRHWQDQLARLQADWAAAATDPDVTADSDAARALAQRHVEWLRAIPGTPAAESPDALVAYVRGLAEMYVSDERFAANYGGAVGARFVRDALLAHVDAAT